MSASSSDSWILVALTILVVFLLFYLSKKMICNSYYEGEESPTSSSSSSFSSSSPSASASNSNSTSFSDYYCGITGSSPFDPGEVSSPSTDDDDFHGIYRANREFWRENECAPNNNNEDHINNMNLRRGIDTSSQVRRSESVGARFYSETRPPISIISSENMDRKTMLEGELRNQITKIVQAEKEIQRLVRILRTEQGMDSRQYLTTRTMMRSLLSPDCHQREIFSAPSDSSEILGRSTLAEATGAEATVETSTSVEARQSSSMLPFKRNDIPSLSHSSSSTSRPALQLNDDDEVNEDDHDHDPHQNNVERRREFLPERNESSRACHSDFLPPQNTDQVSTSSSGIDQRSLVIPRGLLQSFNQDHHDHHHQFCRCNLYASTSAGRIRRMLLLRQMLLPISSFSQVEGIHTHDTDYRSDRLSTTFPPLTSCLHYPPREDVGDVEDELQPAVPHLQHQHFPFSEDDNPPTYESLYSTRNENSPRRKFRLC